MKNQRGFTLIEMLIVLTIITTLLILLIPNLANKNETIQEKGCNALIQMAENQVQSYVIDYGDYPPDITTLIDKEYIQSDSCANGTRKIVFKDGVDHTIYVTDVVNE